jgi:hypothetical protein
MYKNLFFQRSITQYTDGSFDEHFSHLNGIIVTRASMPTFAAHVALLHLTELKGATLRMYNVSQEAYKKVKQLEELTGLFRPVFTLYPNGILMKCPTHATNISADNITQLERSILEEIQKIKNY